MIQVKNFLGHRPSEGIAVIDQKTDLPDQITFDGQMNYQENKEVKNLSQMKSVLSKFGQT